MRVSNNTNNTQAKFVASQAITKPIKDTKADAKSPTSAKPPQATKFNLNDLKGGEFATSLKTNLKPDANNQVHEEMLQSSVVKSILDQANPKAAKLFHSSLESLQSSGMSTEDAVKASLKNLVKEGYLAQSDANIINGVSFRASQLDSNLETLYDNRGSKNDQTIAVDSMDNAILKASEVIGAMQGKDVSPHSRSLDVASNTINQSSATASQIDGLTSPRNSSVNSSHTGSRAGFLWKPVSDSNGKLVVLLPKDLAGKIDSVSVYASPPETGGTPIDQGKFTGNANGNRDHFRFSKPGSSYPDGAYVVANLKDGTQAIFQIGDSSERNS